MPCCGTDPVRSTELSIGIDVGGTKINAVAVDTRSGLVVSELRRHTPADGELIDSLDAVVSALRHATAPSDTVGIGVGLPGLVDRSGVLRAAPNLPSAVDVDLRAALRARTGLPVGVENDATCAALAEWQWGVGRGIGDLVLVTLGTGIGAGLIVDGRPARGAHGFAGEPGHMVVDRNGPVCPCGNRGCWERYASGAGLARLAEEAAGRGDAPALASLLESNGAIRGEDVVAAVRGGDVDAAAVMGEFADWLAVGLAAIVNLLDPEMVVVGGGLGDEADLFLDRARRETMTLVLGGERRPATRIEAAASGASAGARGAALLPVAGSIGEPAAPVSGVRMGLR